jgi:hypothetical protein
VEIKNVPIVMKLRYYLIFTNIKIKTKLDIIVFVIIVKKRRLKNIKKIQEDSKNMELQSGKCFICENDYDVLYIDHNHDTGIIRKLLCRDCNSALGLIKENKKTINNMKKYIEEHE